MCMRRQINYQKVDYLLIFLCWQKIKVCPVLLESAVHSVNTFRLIFKKKLN